MSSFESASVKPIAAHWSFTSNHILQIPWQKISHKFYFVCGGIYYCIFLLLLNDIVKVNFMKDSYIIEGDYIIIKRPKEAKPQLHSYL